MTTLSAFAKRLQAHRFFIGLLLICTFFLFFRLGERSFYSKDEGRYAEIPREMAESGDFITPRLNYVHYFEKPALSYWLTAASYLTFGENEGAARFPVALLGLLTILATYLFGSCVFNKKAGFISALILLMTPGFYLVSRFLVIDGPFTFFCTASLFLFWVGYVRNRTPLLLAAYACMGLSVLTKGLIGIVLPTLIVGSYMIMMREFGMLKRIKLGWGIPLFVLVTAPWFILVSLKNPAFFNFFFIREHFQRYLTTIAGREEPLYFFLMIGALFFLPWTFFVPTAVRQTFLQKDPVVRKSLIFLNVWWVAVIVFFSLSKSKLPPYILPMTPALALIVGHLWHNYLADGAARKGITRGLLAFAAGIVILIPYVLWELLSSLSSDIDAPVVLPYALPGMGLFIIEAIVLVWFVSTKKEDRIASSKRTRMIPFMAIGALLAASYIVVIFTMQKLDTTQSIRALTDEINKDTDSGSVISVLGRYEHVSDIGFYTKRRVVVVSEDPGELTFGRDNDNSEGYFINLEQFRQLFGSGQKVYCVVPAKSYGEFLEEKFPGVKIVKKTPKSVLIVNTPAEEKKGREQLSAPL
jgi:4-amino-4-deoxy-L-arabinose transferase-like glycosyltransferase